MIETFLAIAGDQRVVAGLALLAFSIFVLGCYVYRAERKSRRDMGGWWQP